MPDVYADRVLETSTTTGTGAYTLAGGVAGFITFGNAPAMVDGSTCPYYAEDVDANGNALGGYEIGTGTWNTGGTLTRTSIQASSNGGAAVSWAAGTRRIGLSLTAAAFAAKAALSAAQTFAGAQRGAVTALTSTAASVAIDLATNNNFSHATTENTTLAAPSNPVAGQSGVITITQGATARLLAYNTFWKFPGGTVPTLTAVVGAVDVLAYNVESATRATCQLLKDVK